jgi:hypothetical protein
MRIRLAAVAVAVLMATLVLAGDRTSMTIVKDDDDYWAKFERNGVEYVTRDRAVLAEIERAMEKNRGGSSNHTEIERQRRELERERRALEAKMRDLERRQRDLEAEQRKVEAAGRAHAGDANRAIEQIFERAVREGKAKKN